MPKERRKRSDADRPSAVAENQLRPSAGVTDETVHGRAYEIYEKRGGEAGAELNDWLQAERELRQP